MPERLVVMQTQAAPGELAYFQKRYRIASVFQPRLAVIDLDDIEAAQVEQRPGVDFVIADPREPIPGAFNATEQLFMRAWKLCQSMDKKQRNGEGLVWDADGFLPPDPPP